MAKFLQKDLKCIIIFIAARYFSFNYYFFLNTISCFTLIIEDNILRLTWTDISSITFLRRMTLSSFQKLLYKHFMVVIYKYIEFRVTVTIKLFTLNYIFLNADIKIQAIGTRSEWGFSSLFVWLISQDDLSLILIFKIFRHKLDESYCHQAV